MPENFLHLFYEGKIKHDLVNRVNYSGTTKKNANNSKTHPLKKKKFHSKSYRIVFYLIYYNDVKKAVFIIQILI